MRSDEELLQDKKPVSEGIPESEQQENSAEVEESAVQTEDSSKTVQKLVDNVPDDEKIAKEFDHFNDLYKNQYKHNSDNG